MTLVIFLEYAFLQEKQKLLKFADIPFTWIVAILLACILNLQKLPQATQKTCDKFIKGMAKTFFTL